MGIKRPTNKTLMIAVLVTGLFFSLILMFSSSLSLKNIVITDPKGIESRVPFAYYLRTAGDGPYIIKGTIEYGRTSQTYIHVIVDDCIELLTVNKVPVVLNTVICKTDRGADIDLGPYLKQGSNNVELRIQNYGDRYGILVSNSFRDPRFLLYFADCMIFGGLLLFFFLRRLKLPHGLIFIILGGIVMRGLYLSYTPFDFRIQDLEGHLEFIRSVMKTGLLPGFHDCWECHQQPLFYVLSALIARSVQVVGIQNWYLVLQIAGIGYFTALSVGIATLFRRIFSHPVSQLAATALFVFWPVGIIHSVRVENDILYYASYGLTLFVLYEWFIHKTHRWFVLSFVFMGISLFIKTTNMPLLIMFIGIYVWQNRHNLRNKRHRLFALAVFLLLILNFATYFMQRNDQPFLARVTKSNELTDGLLVGNTAYNYLYFDTRIFLQSPYGSAWSDATGRQFFLNHLLKTSLFGDYAFDTAINRNMAILMSGMLLLALGFAGSYLLLARHHDLRNAAFFGTNALLLICMVLYYRINFPFACNNDFRFVFPILISAIVFYVSVLDKARERKAIFMEYGGYGLLFLFVVFSILFFILYPLFPRI